MMPAAYRKRFPQTNGTYQWKGVFWG